MKNINFVTLRNSDPRVDSLAANLSSPSVVNVQAFSPSLAAAGKMVTGNDDIFLAREELTESTNDDSNSDVAENDDSQ